MAKPVRIKWTEKQKSIAALAKQGLTSREILESGHDRALVFKVLKVLKDEEKAKQPPPQPAHTPVYDKAPQQSKVRIRTLDPVEVGGLYIEPADWRINQYGGFLIMNTYEYARQKFEYAGTVGDFLCEACQVMRRIMGLDIMSFDYLLKGAGNGNGQEAGAGGDFYNEVGDEPDRAEQDFEG